MARGATFVIVAALASAVCAAAQETALGLRMSSQLPESAPAPDRLPAPATSSALQSRLASEAHAGLGDYRIGAEDLLEIQVFGVDQLARTVRVNSFGMVSLPLIGPTPVGGMTAQEAERLIARSLAEKYLQDPQVSVFIKEYTNQRVTIEGAVQKPGIYPLRGETSLLRAIAMAGGPGSLSDLGNV